MSDGTHDLSSLSEICTINVVTSREPETDHRSQLSSHSIAYMERWLSGLDGSATEGRLLGINWNGLALLQAQPGLVSFPLCHAFLGSISSELRRMEFTQHVVHLSWASRIVAN